jgi:hypothetical protein
MNDKLKTFFETKGASVFAILAWTGFVIGGAAFAVFTIAIALTFELCVQIKNKVASLI